jgi:hypothetical protein
VVQRNPQSPPPQEEELMLFDRIFLPYFIHWFVSSLVVLCFAHVQIVTRFICASSPMFYWYCAHVLLHVDSCPSINNCRIRRNDDDDNDDNDDKVTGEIIIDLNDLSKSQTGRYVMLWFLCFNMIGPTLHVNGYPWT